MCYQLNYEELFACLFSHFLHKVIIYCLVQAITCDPVLNIKNNENMFLNYYNYYKEMLKKLFSCV